jgi:hypothetical protein
MLKSYVKTAFRFLLGQKACSLLGILGLPEPFYVGGCRRQRARPEAHQRVSVGPPYADPAHGVDGPRSEAASAVQKETRFS